MPRVAQTWHNRHCRRDIVNSYSAPVRSPYNPERAGFPAECRCRSGYVDCGLWTSRFPPLPTGFPQISLFSRQPWTVPSVGFTIHSPVDTSFLQGCSWHEREPRPQEILQ